MSGKTSVIIRFFFTHNCNKSLWKNIFLVSSHLRTHLTFSLCTSPTATFPFAYHLHSRRFPNLEIRQWSVTKQVHRKAYNSQSPDKFTGKPKTHINIYIYIAQHLPIYEVNDTYPYQGHISTKVLTCHR